MHFKIKQKSFYLQSYKVYKTTENRFILLYLKWIKTKTGDKQPTYYR